MARKAFLPVSVLLAVSLCACGLLPKEEQPVSPPVLKEYNPAQYTTYRVIRGDIQQDVTISASYVHAVTETLSFPIGGVTVTDINAAKGDQVKKGDILAALDTSDLDGPLKDVRNQIAANDKAMSNSSELYKIDKRIAEILTSSALQTVTDYKKRAGDLESERKALDLRLQLLEQKASQRYIVAGIDGVISYVASLKPGDLCEKNRAVFSIDSGSASVFSASGSNAELLTPGMEVDINVNFSTEETYRAKVATPEDLGVTQPQKGYVYMALENPVNFPDGSYGTIKLTAGQRKNVLYVPTEAINTVRERKFVYLLNDNIKTVRDVKIGLQTAYYTEITDGLSEGDEIIVGKEN